MFGKKAKDLELLLTQRNHENDLMRKRISELEAEVAKLKEQESGVLKAITEADKTAARIIDEANANAANINAEANAEHSRLLAEAKQHVCDAAVQANNILSQADAEANSIRCAADEYSRNARSEADKYSENTRTDANIYVERTIMAAQIEVNKRRNVLNELNSLLRSTADYVSDQVLTFTDAIESSANDAEQTSKEITREIDKCSCSCSECANPCHGNEENAEAKDINQPEQPTEAIVEQQVVEQPVVKAPVIEQPAEELEITYAFEKAVGGIADNAVAAEQKIEELAKSAAEAIDNLGPEQVVEECADELGAVAEAAAEKAEDAFDKAADEGTQDPAELMRRIYNIEGRVIPLDNIDDELSDRTPDGGLAFADELGDGTPFDVNAYKLPNDSELDSLLAEVLDK